MEDNNVYYKRGRRYIPFGILRNGHDYLPDGIWYVRHTDHSYGTTNVDHYLEGLYKVGEKPDYIDIPKLCSMHSYTEYVLASPEFKAIQESGSYSLMDLVGKIVALVVKLNQTLKEKENDDNKRPKRNTEAF